MENRLSVQRPVFRKNPHYPISDLFLIVLIYIFEAKKGCKKKSLNKLSLAADLLKSNMYSTEKVLYSNNLLTLHQAITISNRMYMMLLIL